MLSGRTPLARFPVPRKKGHEMSSLLIRWTSCLGLTALLLAPLSAMGDEAAAAELKKVAEEVAQKLEDKKDTKERAVSQRLYVNNTTGYYIDIYVNGSKVGTVNPYNVGNCWVGDPIYGRTILYGQAPGTTMEWGPRVVAEPVTDYTWTLY
jgi:hypothetical protein